MNGKIGIQDLAQRLRERLGLDGDEAIAFAREYFTLIQEALEKDRQVRVPGLGTFRTVDVESRESVDVNTGKRILIDRHAKVTFVAQEEVARDINRPFSVFSSTSLEDGAGPAANDETLPAILELYGVSGKEDVTEPGSNGSEPQAPPSGNVMIPDALEDGPSGSVPVAPETDAPLREDSASDRQPETASGGSGSEALVTETIQEPPLQDVAGVPSSVQGDPSPRKKPERTERGMLVVQLFTFLVFGLIVACVTMVFNLYRPEISEWFSPDSGPGDRALPVRTDSLPPASDSAVRTDSVPPSHDVPARPLADSLASDTASASQRLPESSPKETGVKTSGKTITARTVKVTKEAPAASGKPAPKASGNASATRKSTSAATTSSSSDSAAQYPRLNEGTAYRIDGVLARHTVRRGETLRLIAQKYYGSRSFSTYIAKHNASRFRNPDNVQAGTVIEIPRLVP